MGSPWKVRKEGAQEGTTKRGTQTEAEGRRGGALKTVRRILHVISKLMANKIRETVFERGPAREVLGPGEGLPKGYRRGGRGARRRGPCWPRAGHSNDEEDDVHEGTNVHEGDEVRNRVEDP